MKKTDRSLKSMLSFGAAALIAFGAAAAQVSNSDASFPGAASIDNSGSYQSEVQACRSGNTQQDLATCLREARNAHAEKERGLLTNPGSQQANAMGRCDVFRDREDRAACQARVLGYGDVSGSVAGGGLLRQAETVVVPAGQSSVNVDPQTGNPLVVVPAR
jgi:hypothetical protein